MCWRSNYGLSYEADQLYHIHSATDCFCSAHDGRHFVYSLKANISKQTLGGLANRNRDHQWPLDDAHLWIASGQCNSSVDGSLTQHIEIRVVASVVTPLGTSAPSRSTTDIP